MLIKEKNHEQIVIKKKDEAHIQKKQIIKNVKEMKLMIIIIIIIIMI